MKTMSVSKAALATLAIVGIIFLGQQKVEQVNQSKMVKMVKQLQAEQEAGAAIAMGCIAKGMEDDRLMPHIMMTNGQVCLQVIGKEIEKETSGQGYCSLSDKLCLFKVGYVKTAMALGYPVGNDEEIKARESEAESAFEKNKELRGGE